MGGGAGKKRKKEKDRQKHRGWQERRGIGKSKKEKVGAARPIWTKTYSSESQGAKIQKQQIT